MRRYVSIPKSRDSLVWGSAITALDEANAIIRAIRYGRVWFAVDGEGRHRYFWAPIYKAVLTVEQASELFGKDLAMLFLDAVRYVREQGCEDRVIPLSERVRIVLNMGGKAGFLSGEVSDILLDGNAWVVQFYLYTEGRYVDIRIPENIDEYSDVINMRWRDFIVILMLYHFVERRACELAFAEYVEKHLPERLRNLMVYSMFAYPETEMGVEDDNQKRMFEFDEGKYSTTIYAGMEASDFLWEILFADIEGTCITVSMTSNREDLLDIMYLVREGEYSLYFLDDDGIYRIMRLPQVLRHFQRDTDDYEYIADVPLDGKAVWLAVKRRPDRGYQMPIYHTFISFIKSKTEDIEELFERSGYHDDQMSYYGRIVLSISQARAHEKTRRVLRAISNRLSSAMEDIKRLIT